jgi:hypothetical protein
VERGAINCVITLSAVSNFSTTASMSNVCRNAPLIAFDQAGGASIADGHRPEHRGERATGCVVGRGVAQRHVDELERRSHVLQNADVIPPTTSPAAATVAAGSCAQCRLAPRRDSLAHREISLAGVPVAIYSKRSVRPKPSQVRPHRQGLYTLSAAIIIHLAPLLLIAQNNGCV